MSQARIDSEGLNRKPRRSVAGEWPIPTLPLQSVQC